METTGNSMYCQNCGAKIEERTCHVKPRTAEFSGYAKADVVNEALAMMREVLEQ